MAPVCTACLLLAGVWADDATVFQDKNAISGRVANPQMSSDEVTFLGDMIELNACEQACLSFSGCHGFVWHETDFDSAWAKGCYGILDYTWDLVDQRKIVSGKVGVWPDDGNVTIFMNRNAVSGRVPSPKASSDQTAYLGDYTTLSSCQSACVARADCHGFTWHSTKLGGDWAQGCYGILDWTWDAPEEDNIHSGQVGRWPLPGECVGDDLCNYNGKCVDRQCQCAPQWKGAACDVLNLLPSPQNLGYQGVDDSGDKVTSWGGSVLAGDDGLYHMYASEIEGSCGMNVWLSNSRVIHATSPDPTTTPFIRESVVQGVFAHEPIAARAPTGEYVVFFTAVLAPNPLPVDGGEMCRGCSHGRSVSKCGTDDMRNASVNLPTYMVYSNNPNGPWSEPAMVPGTDVFADSNFAPVINPDGSLIALERGNVVHAKSWRDVTTYEVVGSYADAGEDPFIWRDANGIYHNIVHVNRRHTYGLHYFSVDGLTWTASAAGGHAYEYAIDYDDGSHNNLACRERPHIVQNAEGDIIGLTNGAAPITCHDETKDDYSFTSLQVVGQTSQQDAIAAALV